MKKNLVSILGCMVMLLFASAAYSADGFYVGGNFGLAMASDSNVSDPSGEITVEFDPGIAIGTYIGYTFGKMRIEGEIAGQKNDIDQIGAKISGVSISSDMNGEETNVAFLANGYYDFTNSSPFTPFVSAGIGFANVNIEVEDLDVSDDDTVFAYQVGVGIAYTINERVSIDAKYRYLGTTDVEIAGADCEFGSHNILAGVRISF